MRKSYGKEIKSKGVICDSKYSDKILYLSLKLEDGSCVDYVDLGLEGTEKFRKDTDFKTKSDVNGREVLVYHNGAIIRRIEAL